MKEKNRLLLFLLLSWVWLLLWDLGEAFSYLFLSETLFRGHIWFFVGLAFSITALLDSLSREAVDPLKISIIAALSAIVIVFSLDSEAVESYTFPNGDASLAMAGYFRIVTTVLVFLIGFMYVFYIAKIHWNAPTNLKFYSRLNLLGAILIGILPVVFVALGFTLIIPGWNLVSISSGALLSTIAFIYQPKLAYVLPFKAMRLTVVEIDSGIPLYSYSWSKQEELIDEEQHFSGMISGLSHFARVVLRKGNIREIHLDDAILIFQRSSQFPVACVLFATKSSPSLRTALNFFADRFFQEFSQYFFERVQDPAVYVPTINLVTEYFPFVPVYD